MTDTTAVGRPGHIEEEADSQRPVRVLAVIDGLYLAGAEKLLSVLTRAGAARGIRLDVLSLADVRDDATVVPELRAAGARVETLGARRLLDARALARLARLIRRSDCEVVHAHLRYAVISTPVAARAAGRPVVCSLHHVPGPLPPREHAKERLAVMSANRSDGVVAVSYAQLDGFVRRYGVDPQRWRVIHNGIDLAPFTAAADSPLPEDLRRQVGPRPVVALVARLRAGKGHHLALDAWKQVTAAIPDAHLVLVGDGPLDAELHGQVDRLGLVGRVTFAGPRRDVPAVLGGVDLAVSPSDSEALPTTLIEAAAAGTAVVATDVGGTGEIVDDGRTGLLVPPAAPHALAGAIVELLRAPERRAAMGREGQRLAADRFDAASWAGKLANYYRGVVVGRRGRGGT